MRPSTLRTGALAALAFTLAIVSPALSQHALYSVSWGAPTGMPGAVYDAGAFECGAGDVTLRLFVTVTPTENIANLLAIDALLSFGYQYYPYPGGPPRPKLSPFWHFEDGGCNAGGLLAIVPPSSQASGMPSVFSDKVAYVGSGYAPDYPGDGTARAAVTVTHVAGQGVDLVAGRTYVVFALDFSMCAGAICAGCGEALCVEPAYIRLEQDIPYAEAYSGYNPWTGINSGCSVTLATADPPDARASGGNGPGNAARHLAGLAPGFLALPRRTLDCDFVPAQRHSWGTLKMLYR